LRYFSLPCLIDIYQGFPEQDEYGEIRTTYNAKVEVPCSFRTVNPQSNLEKFGERYQDKGLLLLEIPPKFGPHIDLNCRATNLRSKDAQYYPGNIFNVDGINPVSDWRGHVLWLQVWLVLTNERAVQVEG